MNNSYYILLIYTLTAFLCFNPAIAAHTGNENDPEKMAFWNPPKETRPFVFMWWYDNVHTEAITEHLEELHNKGIGGVIVFYHGGMPGVDFFK